MTEFCNACGERITPANDNHSFNEPDPKTGDPSPIITCNIHNVVCGMRRDD